MCWYFCQFIGNIVELAQSFGFLPIKVQARHYAGRGLCVFGTQPRTATDEEQDQPASHAGGDPEQKQGTSLKSIEAVSAEERDRLIVSRLARQAGMVRPPAHGDILRSRPKSRAEAASKTQCVEYDVGTNESYQSIGPIAHNTIIGPVMLVSSYNGGIKQASVLWFKVAPSGIRTVAYGLT